MHFKGELFEKGDPGLVMTVPFTQHDCLQGLLETTVPTYTISRASPHPPTIK